MKNTDIRQAILKAANHIEANPGLFDFQSLEVPGCGTPGCIVGWVGHFMGVEHGTNCWGDDCVGIMGVESNAFFDRMLELQEQDETEEPFTSDVGVAARFMRLYADKYHPESYPEVSKELARIFSDTRGATA